VPLAALALVLIAALMHASWNIAVKQVGGDYRFALLTALGATVFWAPAALWMAVDEWPRWGWLQWTSVVASAVVHIAYMLTLLRGYREADLTVVYPVARGSGPLLTSIAAVVLLDERPGALGLAGILAVCAGVFLIAGGPHLWRQAHDPGAHERVRAGLLWGVLIGAMIATYSVIDGFAIKMLAMGPILFDWIGNVLRVPMLMPLAWRDRASLPELWRRQWKAALMVSLLGPAAYMMVLYAVRLAPLSHVAPAREVSMLFAALIGGRLLGERDRGLRMFGALCMAAGVAALASA